MNLELPPGLVLRPGTRLFDALDGLSRDKQMFFIVGSAGVGKSLLLQQTALLALQKGRGVHLLRWDVARLSFEQAPGAEAYALVDGVTHAAIRLAVGRWVRAAVGDWYANKNREDVLIAECPMVGNRFVELAQQWDDPLEGVLSGDSVRFLIPAPTSEVRAEIESLRAQEMENPRHAQEAHNAPASLLQGLMGEIHALSEVFGLGSGDRSQGYVPEIYLGVFSKVLRHRPQTPLLIDEVLPVTGSAQAMSASCIELVPKAQEVEAALAWVRRLSDEHIQRRVSEWWRV